MRRSSFDRFTEYPVIGVYEASPTKKPYLVLFDRPGAGTCLANGNYSTTRKMNNYLPFEGEIIIRNIT